MRILLILLVIIAVFVVVQAQAARLQIRRNLDQLRPRQSGNADRRDAAAATAGRQPRRQHQHRRPSTGSVSSDSVYCKAKPRAPGGVRGLFDRGPLTFDQRIGKISFVVH